MTAGGAGCVVKAPFSPGPCRSRLGCPAGAPGGMGAHLMAQEQALGKRLR